jgi:hypothetical protein
MDIQTYRHTEIEATMDTRHRTKENRKLKRVTQTINKGGAKIMSLALLPH